eukprot:1161500-Pelagomonas_calceolata.AAC.4
MHPVALQHTDNSHSDSHTLPLVHLYRSSPSLVSSSTNLHTCNALPATSASDAPSTATHISSHLYTSIGPPPCWSAPA